MKNRLAGVLWILLILFVVVFLLFLILALNGKYPVYKESKNDEVKVDSINQPEDNEFPKEGPELIGTPKLLVDEVAANAFPDSSVTTGSVTYNLAPDEGSTDPKRIELQGYIVSKTNIVCVTGDCPNTNEDAQDIQEEFSIHDFFSSQGLTEIDPFNSAAGGYNFTEGKRRDNIVCVYSGLIAETVQPGKYSNQEVKFGCAYIEP